MSAYHQVSLEVLEGLHLGFKIELDTVFVTAQPVIVREPEATEASPSQGMSVTWGACRVWDGVQPSDLGNTGSMDGSEKAAWCGKQQQFPKNYTQHVNVINVLNKT